VRKPTGYVGAGHQIIGSELLSVLAVVPMAKQVLGEDLAGRLAKVKPDQWYPIAHLLEAHDRVDAVVGRNGLLQLGRRIFAAEYAPRFQRDRTARDLLHRIDAMYRQTNRGQQIGGWRVDAFRPGHAELVKSTPQHCVVSEGLLSAAMLALGIPATIEQRECFRNGAGHCRFAVVSPVIDEHWCGPVDQPLIAAG
jgi:hypothetical protein